MKVDNALARIERDLSVSRETTERLEAFAQLVLKWNGTINLIAKGTESDLWSRHIMESCAVFAAAPNRTGRWTDLGSGAGFPGAVVAILAADLAPGLAVTCIEADIRKCAFLRTVSRETGAPFNVLSRRIEEVPAQNANVLSARALAPLDRLLPHCARHLSPDGRAVFAKGETWRAEVEAALENWRFTLEKVDSPTQPGSAILIIGDVVRA